MPSTYYSLHAHLIFSTKNRHPYFDADLNEEVHSYLGGAAKGVGFAPLAVGGVADHVHLLVGMKPTHCMADMVREVKKSSNSWIQKRHLDFAWQEGYGAFSVSPERIVGVTKYIVGQEEHHRTKTFQEEYIELLRFAGIEFNEADLF